MGSSIELLTPSQTWNLVGRFGIGLGLDKNQQQNDAIKTCLAIPYKIVFVFIDPIKTFFIE